MESMTQLERTIIECHRKAAAHERMVNDLYKLMSNEDFDYAMDIVRDEYRAIHGPND